MAHLSGVPVRPNSLRPPLAVSARSRFSLGAPPEKATAAGARHRRSNQPARAAAKEAAQPPREPRGGGYGHEDETMGRKGRKGGKLAAAGGAADGAGVREATMVRVSKVLEEFRASDAEGSHHLLLLPCLFFALWRIGFMIRPCPFVRYLVL
jgi:hypothetical protein